MSSQLYTDLLRLPVKRSLSLEFSLAFRAGGLGTLKKLYAKRMDGHVCRFHLFLKRFKSPEIVNNPSCCQGTVTC